MNRFFTPLLAASCLTAVGQVPDYVPTDGLVAWIPLDDANTFFSEQGEIDILDTYQALPAPDRFGVSNAAYLFDGDDDFIALDSDTQAFDFSGQQEISISIWVKPNSSGPQFGLLGYSPILNGNPQYALKIESSGGMYFISGAGLFEANGFNLGTTPLSLGQWSHLVMTYDGVEIKFFLDGQLEFQNVVSDTLPDALEGSRLFLGKAWGAENTSLNGVLDDAGLWSRALDLEDVQQLYLSDFAYAGCTDPSACNYADAANIDDGSCHFNCQFCHDGTAWDEELFKCVVANPSDSNFDGCVQLNDLLDLLSAYGDCGAEESAWQCGDSLEYQGYDYETVQIGEQCWFAENLRAENYRNGESLGSTLMAWLSSTEEGQTVIYGADSEISCQDFSPEIPVCDSLETTFLEFGLLYNNHAISDIRGVCPLNWHVSTDEDWMILESFLGIPEEELTETGFRGINQGQIIKTTYGWKGGGSGSDAVGFHGKPAGGFSPEVPNFNNAGSDANWWAPSDVNALMRRNLNDYTSGIRRVDIIENAGISIRCIKDAE